MNFQQVSGKHISKQKLLQTAIIHDYEINREFEDSG